jgi:hypothetical protein
MNTNGHNNGSPHLETKHLGRPIEINGETVFQWQHQHPAYHKGVWITPNPQPEKPEKYNPWPYVLAAAIALGIFAKGAYDDYLADWQKTERQTFIEQAILTKGWDAHGASVVWDDIQKASSENKGYDEP